MTATIPTLSRRRRWTYADYCKIPPDRYRHEIIDGRHFVNPERAGVPEFWIVDPKVPCIEQYVLRERKYGKPVVCKESVRLHVLRSVTIDLKRVW